jgi:hypothetical protein
LISVGRLLNGKLVVNPFIDGPTDFLSKKVCLEIAKEELWVRLFGENIDCYPRTDYGVRNLPAMRAYVKGFNKQFESWFIEGNLTVDLILPAVLRRFETEEVPDVICSAMLQQFRRPEFFEALCEEIPGLNEMGKTFSVDKDLAYQWESELVPLTRMTVNFKIDLREWDKYLEQTDRTKGEPFRRTLADLEKLVGTVEAYRVGSSDPELDLQIEQSTKGD